MLINFTFKNFRSFRDEQQFSMLRDGARGADAWAHPEVSTACAIYGPNASGKSNLLRAVEFASGMVRDSYRGGPRGALGPYDPFLLSAGTEGEPVESFVEFIAPDGLRYKYWFSTLPKQVVSEELVVYRSSAPSLLFSRWVEDGGQRVKFGPSLKGPKQQLWQLTKPETLLLSVAGASGLEATLPAYEAMAGMFGFYDAPSYEGETLEVKTSVGRGGAVSDALPRLLKCADLGISGIETRDSTPDPLVMQSLEQMIAIGGFSGDQADAVRRSVTTDLFYGHVAEGGETRWFPSKQESDGTRAATSFFSAAIRTLASGSVALVDEIDASLHPTLVEALVELFTDPVTNPNQAQLIFTTHDVSLINKSGRENMVLERDQVWLVDKDERGASSLVPVTDFSPRPDENLGRNYLNGVYRALPTPSIKEAVASAMRAMREERDAAGKGGEGA